MRLDSIVGGRRVVAEHRHLNIIWFRGRCWEVSSGSCVTAAVIGKLATKSPTWLHFMALALPDTHVHGNDRGCNSCGYSNAATKVFPPQSLAWGVFDVGAWR